MKIDPCYGHPPLNMANDLSEILGKKIGPFFKQLISMDMPDKVECAGQHLRLQTLTVSYSIMVTNVAIIKQTPKLASSSMAC